MTIAVDDQYLDCSIELIGVDQPSLLVERVGVAGVAVLVGRRLQVAHGRQLGAARAVQRRRRSPRGRTGGWPGRCSRSSARTSSAAGGPGSRSTRSTGTARGAARSPPPMPRRCSRARIRTPGAPLGGGRRREAALEPAPGDVRRVQQVADVLAGHRRRARWWWCGSYRSSRRSRGHRRRKACRGRSSRSRPRWRLTWPAGRAWSGPTTGRAPWRRWSLPEVTLIAPGVDGP